ncbi:helix-turn-helix domain-containing protein (plasmid) [Natrialbaceae archaeon A-arb3/5]
MAGRISNVDGLIPDGGRIPRVTPEDALEVLTDREDRAEPLTAPELAEILNCSRRTALNKLQALEEQDAVASKKVGARSRVWWVPLPPSTSPDPIDGHERRETPPERMDDQSPAPPVDRDDGANTAALEDTDDDLREQVRAVLPGSGETLDARTDAVLEMYDLIRDRGGDVVTTGELKDVVNPDAVGYSSIGSFWNNAVKKNAAQDRPNALTTLPDVVELGNGRYRYAPGGE